MAATEAKAPGGAASAEEVAAGELKQFPAAQRDEAIRRRVFPAAVFEAGEARLASVRLLPGEEAILGGIGDYVMTRHGAPKP